MKPKIAVALLLLSTAFAFAGPDPVQIPVEPAPIPAPSSDSLFRDTEFDVSLLGTGIFTQTAASSDRYFGADHAFGGTLNAKFFFAKYFGTGLSVSGFDVRNVLGPNFGNGHRFVGDFLPTLTFRYPIGNFAPYVFAGVGTIFNGGNRSLKEPSNGSFGRKIRFEVAEHDAQVLSEAGIGVEYRLNKNIGFITEAVFDKVARPQSNFGGMRAGVNIAF